MVRLTATASAKLLPCLGFNPIFHVIFKSLFFKGFFLPLKIGVNSQKALMFFKNQILIFIIVWFAAAQAAKKLQLPLVQQIIGFAAAQAAKKFHILLPE